MVLLIAVATGLIATLIRAKLFKRNIRKITLKTEWLVLIAVIPQIIAFSVPATAKLIPDSYLPLLLISSMTGLLAFSLVNFRTRGFGLMSGGLFSNLVAIITNGGWMPISPKTLFKLHPELPVETWKIGERLAISKDRIIPTENTHLAFLTDVIPVPTWIPYKFAFSIGDILLSSGVFLLLWSLSQGE